MIKTKKCSLFADQIWFFEVKLSHNKLSVINPTVILTMESQSEKAQRKPKGSVYYSKFTLEDYLRTRTMININHHPPGPTQKDFIKAANMLRPTAQPFFPSQQLNPRAEEFSPRRAESFVLVRSLDYEDGKSCLHTFLLELLFILFLIESEGQNSS